MKKPSPTSATTQQDFADSLRELDHVRHEPGHVLAPGLFRSVARGDYKRQKLDVVYEFSSGEKIEFGAKEPLGAPELRVLQALIAMAGPEGILLGSEPKTESGQQLRLLLETKFDAVEANALVVKGSYRRLAKVAGYKDIEDVKNIRKSIERLWGVSVIVRSRGKNMGFRLLSDYESEDTDGRLYVALNPRIAKAVMGEAQHCRIELSEVWNLKSDVARLIHQRLSGWIDAGKSGLVGIDTLLSYAWPDPAEGSTGRMRKKFVKAAIAELTEVGWEVSEYVKEKFKITRPGRTADNKKTD